jgi:hypothetical protein
MQGKIMATSGILQAGATPTPSEVEAVATVLEARHGTWAAGVAEFFSTMHGLNGHAERSWAWADVAETVRRRAQTRQAGTPA